MARLTPIPAGKRPLISELLDRGMSTQEVADNLGFTRGQVRGAIERYRLRKTPYLPGGSKFTDEIKRDLVQRATQMVNEGKTLPLIADEIERTTGVRVASNTIRDWLPRSLAPLLKQNAIQAIAMHSRTRGIKQRKQRKAMLEENERLRAEVTRLKARLRRLEG